MPLCTAITATAARTALGDDVPTTWQRMCAGASAVAPLDVFAARAARIWTEPEASEDDPALRILGPHGRLLDDVARAAHEEARLGELPRETVGLFIGVGMVDAPIADLAAAALASRDAGGSCSLPRFFAGAYRMIHPLWPLSMLGNVAAGQIAIDLDLRGDNLVTASDADAGLRALLEGARSVDAGTCRAAIAGGASGRLTPQHLARLALQGRLPGVAPGEGGAALALEDPARADARGSAVHGWLRGGATTFGGAHGAPGPRAATWVRAIQTALAEAGVEAAAIDVVFLHAEGLPAADAAEVAALTSCGLDRAPRHASKAAVGHLGAASAALDATLALEALAGGAGRYALVLAAGPHGGAGALVLEGAA